MSYPIEDIEGIGSANADKLSKAGITKTGDLLDKCAAPAGRRNVAETSGVSEAMVLRWTNMADLMRISGVAEEYSDLLEAAGVDTVKELRNRNPENLAAKMAEVNEQKKLTRQVPSASQVTKWVEQANELEPILTY